VNYLDAHLVSAHQQQLLGAACRRRLERSAARHRTARRPWRRSSIA
jgi:hypothetical protein